MPHVLGADVGGTKTDVVVIDDDARVVGTARSGAGNPEGVGPDGLHAVLASALDEAVTAAGIEVDDLAGAGFGVAGLDWPEDLAPIRDAIDRLGLSCPTRIVNDAVPGLVIGAPSGWGVSLVAGTGCNCYGRSADGSREGRVSGMGALLGEAAGASELVRRAMQIVNDAWIRRCEPTALTDVFIAHVGASSAEDLLAGYTRKRYRIGASAAPLVFVAADDGDRIAQGLVDWAGSELGELVNAVVRQLDLQTARFDVVLSGGMVLGSGSPGGGQRLLDSLHRTVTDCRAWRVVHPPRCSTGTRCSTARSRGCRNRTHAGSSAVTARLTRHTRRQASL